MTQPRHHSAAEAAVNIAAGIALQFILGITLLHWLGFQITMRQNLIVTGVMTVASFSRQYLIRRAFNAAHERSSPWEHQIW